MKRIRPHISPNENSIGDSKLVLNKELKLVLLENLTNIIDKMVEDDACKENDQLNTHKQLNR